MDTMMALRAHSRGGPEQLSFEQAPVPVAGTGDVLVAVHAAGITFDELSWDETWTTAAGAERTPVIPAHELSGTVAAVGHDVTGFVAGDEVFGLIDFDRDGAAAEYVTVPAVNLARKPASISHAEAASLSLAALTAWQAVVDYADVALGEQVLVLGGAGAVGAYVVQVAALRGGHVTATDSGAHTDLVKTLGARHVVIGDLAQSEQTLPPIDVVIDTVGGGALSEAYPLVRQGGRLVTLGGPPPPDLAGKYDVHAMFFIVGPDAAETDHLGELLAAGELRSMISEEYPLREGRQAYASGRPGRPPGKTILVVR